MFSKSLSHLFRGLSVLTALVTLTSSLLAQNPPAPGGAPSEDRGQRRQQFNPEEMRTRMLNAVREQLGVTSDEEWALISERIIKVAELRRTVSPVMGMGMAMRGMGGQSGQDNNRGRAMRGGNNPEVETLQMALKDKAPDAEIKARLTRLREVRKENEAKLEKAQEELRAVLTVRQEAIAVIAGWLP
ncbi:MAG: hypothetical protein HZA31_07155 [Opitutae bacterium]|nr:hypothetical protein [Opitutae bacterium]